MPDPSSRTRMRVTPPPSISTSMREALASSAFSTNSLTAEAGRATTSPAAIRSMTGEGRTWIRGTATFLSPSVRRQGMAPAKACEAAVIPVCRDPLAAGLDCDRGKVGVGRQVAASRRFPAETLEDGPMTRPWLNRNSIRRFAHGIGKRERGRERSRRIEDPGMCDDAEKASEDQLRDSVRFLTVDDVLQPGVIFRMPLRVLPERVDENVDVSEKHVPPFVRSEPPSRPVHARQS